MNHTDVAIIGAGFAGLGMAISLKQAGEHDFTVFERGEEVGGTWWFNTYPGCQCDIPSHLYSFSFAPNPGWSRTYSEQPEIEAYLKDCADRFALRPHIKTSTDITSAEWDPAAGRWRLTTGNGDVVQARVLVAGFGPLSEPSIPKFDGLDSFTGKTMHTAQWDESYDFAGKRVAVVGTGASSIQVVPKLQREAAKLHVFQRTPPWIVPHRDRPISDFERRLYKAVPALQKVVRSSVYWAREALVPGLAYDPRLQVGVQKLAEAHIRAQVEDPELREKVTPDYTIGCKRILPSNNWYPALSADNAELVTDSIASVTPTGVVTEDGVEREVDAIVFGTGFYVTDIPFAAKVRGADGRTLEEVWDGSPQAYRGTTIAGYPNLFLLLGPNTGLGHNSVVFMVESQIRYVLDALRRMRGAGIDAVDVRPAAQERWNARVQEKLKRTVWNTGGCSSWYLDRHGRNATLWPDFTWKYRLQMRRFDASAYSAVAAGDALGARDVAAAEEHRVDEQREELPQLDAVLDAGREGRHFPVGAEEAV